MIAVAALAAIACSLPRLLLGTPDQVIQCTPPPCAADETYACGSASGDCPGGCGTICIKKTPDPATQPVTPTSVVTGENPYCTLVVRQPPAEAPTASVNGTAQPDQRVDPHVAVCASSARPSAGQELVLVARAIDIGLPLFQLSVRDEGAPDFTPLVRQLSDSVEIQAQASALLEYVSWRDEEYGRVIVLRAAAPGRVELQISATGEIHYGYPGPAMWGGGGSDVVAINVQP